MSTISNVNSSYQKQWTEDIADALFRILLEHFTTSTNAQNAWRRAAYITLIYLCRPGWPGADLSQKIRKEIFAELLHLAKPFYYVKDAKTISQFAKNAAAALLSRVSDADFKNLVAEKTLSAHPMGRLATAIKGELLLTNDQQAAVSRAAKRMYQQTQRQSRDFTYPSISPDNPLRTILALPKSQDTKLPKQDIRAHMLKCQNVSSQDHVPLLDLLQKVAPFSPRLLLNALGEELFTRFRPLGYADRHGRVVLIKVKSSSDAHELTFRKSEILQRLKKVRGFESANDVRASIHPILE